MTQLWLLPPTEITALVLNSDNMVSSDDLKEAISKHSQSVTLYKSYGKVQLDDLVPTIDVAQKP